MKLTWGILLVLAAALIQSAANLLLRGGVRQFAAFSLAPERLFQSLLGLLAQPLFVLGAVCYAVSAIVWFRVISLEDLTTAYPVLIGVSFVVVSVGAVVFYDERVNFMKVAGMTLILIGVAMVGGAKA